MSSSFIGVIADRRDTNREMVAGLQSVLENRYGSILDAAGHEWQRRFAQTDPSDACVTVRITGWDAQERNLVSASSRRELPAFGHQAAA